MKGYLVHCHEPFYFFLDEFLSDQRVWWTINVGIKFANKREFLQIYEEYESLD